MNKWDKMPFYLNALISSIIQFLGENENRVPSVMLQYLKIHESIYAILLHKCGRQLLYLKIVSEYDQEIPQSQTADNPVAPRGRATQPLRDTR